MLAEKERLDNFINKQRVAMYKPIQVAEILYRVRTGKDEMSLDKLSNVENYRNPSKRWRDGVTRLLIGQVSTSSQKYQDNVFESNAVPPDFLRALAEINNRFGGVVERYIYQRFGLKQRAIFRIRKYVDEALSGQPDIVVRARSFPSKKRQSRSDLDRQPQARV